MTRRAWTGTTYLSWFVPDAMRKPEPQVSDPPRQEQQPDIMAVPTGGARVLGEAFRTYIVAEDETGLLLI